jgi:hypothetical protein
MAVFVCAMIIGILQHVIIWHSHGAKAMTVGQFLNIFFSSFVE